ncbi:MAG: hypothetical protein QOI52_1781 [Chloroflexota bacterium]|nr:hypothetical protein [Chloroflexota bacterium]
MRVARVILLLSGLFVAPAICLGENIHITFDRPPDGISSNQTFVVPSYFEAGMGFRSTPGLPGVVWRGSDSPFWPTDGTPYLHADAGGPLMFSFDDGSLFSLNGISLAGYSSAHPNITVDFIGHRRDGYTITESVQVDGVNFTPHVFDSRWSILTSVEIASPEWVIDNLLVTVPEPSGISVVFAALATSWVARVIRRKK